jgi:hypothetical protein
MFTQIKWVERCKISKALVGLADRRISGIIYGHGDETRFSNWGDAISRASV